MTRNPRLIRGVLAALGLTAVAFTAAPGVPLSHDAGRLADPFAALLVDGAEIALFGVSAWLAVASGLVTLAAARGPRSRAARIAARVTPRFWARVLGAVLGGAACFGHVTAQAVYDDPASPSIVGLRLPDRPVGALALHSDDAPSHVVRRGDTLWDIATEQLPPDSTVADRARACRRWYAANRAAIGADPDLLLPGTRLHPPTERRRTP